MDTKEYLKEYGRSKRKIAALYEQKLQCKKDIEGLSAVVSDGMPHANNISDLSNKVIRLEEITERIDREVEKYKKRMKEINEIVMAIQDPIAQAILSRRYIGLYKWEDIAVIEGLSWADMHRKHASALKDIVINNEIE